jgi:cysteine-rich repeat protein
VSCQDIANDDDKYQSSYNDKKEKCDEVCGDGFNMGINECDDGNKIDKDGCSSNCRVERGYKCRGGSATQKDLCQKILPILGDISMKIESQVNSEKGALKIEFDDKVKLNPIYATTFRDKIKVFLNGTCEKTDLRYKIEIFKDRSGYETLKINY